MAGPAKRGNVITLASVRRGNRPPEPPSGPRPTKAQRAWLARGLGEAGGKLPLFDDNGRRISTRTVKSCLRQGWAEPWFDNPLKPDWLICKLTSEGRKVLQD